MIGRIFERYEEFSMTISVICGASMLILLFLPESPHWFILNGKREEFLATMKEAARQNKAELTDLEELVPLPKPKDERMTRARLQFSLWKHKSSITARTWKLCNWAAGLTAWHASHSQH